MKKCSLCKYFKDGLCKHGRFDYIIVNELFLCALYEPKKIQHVIEDIIIAERNTTRSKEVEYSLDNILRKIEEL